MFYRGNKLCQGNRDLGHTQPNSRTTPNSYPYFIYAIKHWYPRVTSFDALKQSTDICAHQITFSSRKFIILNKLSCFQSKHTFWEVREHLFCLKYRCQRVYVSRCTRHQFRRLSLAVEENDVFTVVQCSHGVLCIVQERPKIISSS